MIRREKEKKEIMINKSITCDLCKKEYFFDHTMKSDMEIEEFVSINHTCGFASIIDDGKVISIDLCQYCFKSKFDDLV